MMKRFVKWGAVLSVCTAISTAYAEIPLHSPYQQWQAPRRPDIYSRILNFRFAGMSQEETSPSDLSPEPLPAEDAAHGSSAMSETGTTFQHYGDYDGYIGGHCGTGHCGTGHCGTGCCGWFGGLYGIGFDRTDDTGVVLSYDAVNPVPAVLTTDAADIDYGAGAEARFGKYLNNCYAIEMSYWGLFPDRSTSYICNACDGIALVSAIEFDGLVYDNGTGPAPVADFFGTIATPAQLHRVRRNFEAHNVEVNLIRNPCRRSGCGRTHFELIAGFRYLKFDDDFNFASDINNDTLGDDPLNELYYGVEVENHMFGFQTGGRADYKLTQCLSLNGGIKFGLYGNHITHRQALGSGAGGVAVNPVSLDAYVFDVSDNELSFLGELFVGASYDVTCRWRITGGYRAISTSGVALATSQIPRAADFLDFSRSRATDHQDALLLHGAYAGVEYNW